MSEENVEFVRRLYAQWNAGELEGLKRVLDPDCEWIPVLGTAGVRATVYRGPEGLVRYRREVEEVVGGLTTDLHSLEAGRETVLVHLTVTLEGAKSGITTTSELFHVWTVRGGKLIRGESFERRDEAVEAAGLSE